MSKTPEDSPHYVRFEAKHGLVTQGDGKDHWEALLSKCVYESSAQSAFLMDDQGLIIAVSGPLGADRAQEIGARLQPGLDQTEQINANKVMACTLCVQVGDGWVDATRFSHSGMRLTLGLLTHEPIPQETRSATLRILEVAEGRP